jgi:hypothetical protein
MTIRSGNIPAAAIEELRKGVGELSGFDPGIPGLQPGVPHETFHLGLDSVGAGMSGVEPVGWRFLLGTTGPEATHAAEVLTRNQVYAFAGLNRGPFVQQMVDVMRTANVPDDYEARMLRIPALYVVAVWLANDKGNDLFIPLKPTNPVLQPGRVYQQAEFEAALVEAAQKMASATRPDANDPDRGPRAP